MIPLTLTLHNFGSFLKPQTFTFPRKPGLYCMWGNNKMEPRLGPNGAGKSTLWKAITWLFFERTAAGLKAGDISNWDVGKGTSVSLTFDDNQGLTHTVMRSWAPNKWIHTDPCGNTHDLTKGTENHILALLRLNFTAFTQTIVMPQDTDLFMELKGDTQTSLFSDVMNLDKWVRFSDKASAQARTLDIECRRLERELSTSEGKLAAARVSAVWDGDVDWQKQQDRKHDDLEDSWERLREKRRKANEARIVAEDEVGIHRTKLAASSDLTRLEDSLSDAKQDHALARDYAARTEGENNTEMSRRELLRGVSRCPTCDHPVDGSEVKDIQRHLDAGVSKVVHLWEVEARARDHVTQCTMNLDLAVRAVRDLQDALRVAESDARNEARVVADIDKQLDALEEQFDALEKAVNPFERLRREAEANIRDYEAAVRATKRQLDDMNLRYSVAGNWVKWFKDIRLSQIDAALQQLEIEVNNQVEALGLVDWEIRFGVDRETKGGTLQRGFAVTVRAPGTTRPVPWKAWSGGEKQRLTAAVQMGLANLTRTRSGCNFDLEVWDEPTRGMSQQGIQDLLEALHTRAQREGRQIWVVDHHILGFNKFAGSAGVIKDENGSHFDLSSMPV